MQPHFLPTVFKFWVNDSLLLSHILKRHSHCIPCIITVLHRFTAQACKYAACIESVLVIAWPSQEVGVCADWICSTQ
jgi:hypothetical protein